MLIGDVTVSDPREALQDLSNSSKVGVGIILVIREALETSWQPFLHRDNVKVCYTMESLLDNMAIPKEIQSLATGRLYTLAAKLVMKVEIEGGMCWMARPIRSRERGRSVR